MKAWHVHDRDYEWGYIVFAPTRNEARLVGLEFTEWIDVEAHRMPKLDGLRDRECTLDWQKSARIYYEAGWRPTCDADLCCSICERYEYEEFPESVISAETGCCASCDAKKIDPLEKISSDNPREGEGRGDKATSETPRKDGEK